MKKRTLPEIFTIFLKGLLMGAADLVPGVSGGTIAFITGIYQDLIGFFSSFKFSFLLSWKKLISLDWKFIIPLSFGVGFSIITLSKLMLYLLENFVGETFSFFFGLILASAIFLLRKLKTVKFEYAIFVILGSIISYVVASANVLQFNHSLPIIFLSGILALCAMVLPGISGSFVLLLLNQYYVVINSIHELNFKILAVFGVGALTGLLGFSRILNYLFKKYKYWVISLLTGLMLGSLAVPYREIETATITLPMILMFGVLGFLLVLVVERVFGKNKEF